MLLLQMKNFFHIDYISNNFVFFAAGVCLKKFIQEEKSPIFLTGMGFVAFQYLFHFLLQKTFEDKGALSFIVALISILFVISISQFLAKRKRLDWVIFIGSSSLAIYILHVLLASGLRIILQNFFNVHSTIIHLILGFTAGIVFPIVIVKIVNKYKIPYVFSFPLNRH